MAGKKQGGKKAPGKKPGGKKPGGGGGGAGGGGVVAGGGGGAGGFQFEDPQFSPDNFSNFSSADRMADTSINVNNPPLQKIPPLRQDPPVLSLGDVLAPATLAEYSKFITFHAGGDSGGIKEPSSQFMVADKLAEDFTRTGGSRPAFFYHLGDIVYYFGQDKYYYDQFYDPYRNYAGPIFAIPGNHDAVVYPGESAISLEAFQKHFCSPKPVQTQQSMGMARTTMTQPGVYFTLNAPFVKIIGLYSNTQEGSGAGVIADNKTVGQAQKNFLIAQLKQAAADRKTAAADPSKFQAVVLAVHHPPFTGSSAHNPSPNMLADIDDACKQAGFIPDAVLSGHAHLYERFTRYIQGRQVPFVVAGTAGFYNLIGLKRQPVGFKPPVPPVESKDQDGNRLVLENYFDKTYGFLRLTVSADVLSCEFVGVSNVASPAQTLDRFTVDLANHSLIGFQLP
jgi:Calcineurin-like phosphoesterase